VSEFKVRGLGEVRRGRSDESYSATWIRTGCRSLCDWCGMQLRISLCRFSWNSCDRGSLRKPGRRRDRKSRGV